MSLQLRLRDTWLPRLLSRFLAASFKWNVPSSCRTNKPPKTQLQVWFMTGTWISPSLLRQLEAPDLYGKDEDSTTSHHIEEQDHGFILMGRVGVKYPLGHHMTLWDTHTHTHKTTYWLTEKSEIAKKKKKNLLLTFDKFNFNVVCIVINTAIKTVKHN